MTASEHTELLPGQLKFDLLRSFDPPSQAHAKENRDLYNVIDWRGVHRGQIALTSEERYALTPLQPAAALPDGAEPVPVAWKHPKLSWVSQHRDDIAVHCVDGEEPVPLFASPTGTTDEQDR